MADIFINQQEERISQNKKDLLDVGRIFHKQVFGAKEKSTEGDGSADTATRIKIKPVFLPDGKLKVKELLRVMLKQVTKRDVTSVMLASLGITLMGMFTPYVTKQFYDEMIPSGDGSLLLPLATLLVSAAIGSIMFGITKALVLLRIRDKMSAALQSALMERMYRMPANFFQTYTAGKLGNMLMNICNVMQSLVYKLLTGGMAIIFSVIYFFQIFNYTPSLLWLSIIAMLLQVLLMALYIMFAQKEQTRVRKATSEMSGMLYNMMRGMMKIKSTGAEERIFNRWAHIFVDTLTQRADRSKLLVFYPALSAMLTIGTTTITYYFTIIYGISLSNYAAYLSSYGLIVVGINSFALLLPELIVLRPAINQCRPLLETEPEKRKATDANNTVEFLSGKIEINDLSFRYNERSPYIFKNFNLTINPGEYVALVGGSGCGKSTLIRLLLGFEKPESGSIFYDQHDIETADIQSLRQHIGTCLQDGKIFGGEVYENITITNPGASREDAWEAARLACFDKDIQELPMGMHTLLSEGGGGLSGGQCQRLLIARALVAHPSILFFDEATSALDNITQRIVAENLDKMKCTRISIAHRLSTIKHCDRIIVLSGGKVAEEGNFEQLMALHGQFYELAKRQIME